MRIKSSLLTSLLQKDAAFRNDDRNVAIDIGFALFIHERNGDVGVRNALPEGNAEYAFRVHWNG